MENWSLSFIGTPYGFSEYSWHLPKHISPLGHYDFDNTVISLTKEEQELFYTFNTQDTEGNWYNHFLLYKFATAIHSNRGGAFHGAVLTFKNCELSYDKCLDIVDLLVELANEQKNLYMGNSTSYKREYSAEIFKDWEQSVAGQDILLRIRRITQNNIDYKPKQRIEKIYNTIFVEAQNEKEVAMTFTKAVVYASAFLKVYTAPPTQFEKNTLKTHSLQEFVAYSMGQLKEKEDEKQLREEQKARQEAEEQARREAEQKARLEKQQAKEQAIREAEQKASLEKQQAEEQARREAERKKQQAKAERNPDELENRKQTIRQEMTLLEHENLEESIETLKKSLTNKDISKEQEANTNKELAMLYEKNNKYLQLQLNLAEIEKKLSSNASTSNYKINGSLPKTESNTHETSMVIGIPFKQIIIVLSVIVLFGVLWITHGAWSGTTTQAKSDSDTISKEQPKTGFSQTKGDERIAEMFNFKFGIADIKDINELVDKIKFSEKSPKNAFAEISQKILENMSIKEIEALLRDSNPSIGEDGRIPNIQNIILSKASMDRIERKKREEKEERERQARAVEEANKQTNKTTTPKTDDKKENKDTTKTTKDTPVETPKPKEPCSKQWTTPEGASLDRALTANGVATKDLANYRKMTTEFSGNQGKFIIKNYQDGSAEHKLLTGVTITLFFPCPK